MKMQKSALFAKKIKISMLKIINFGKRKRSLSLIW